MFKRFLFHVVIIANCLHNVNNTTPISPKRNAPYIPMLESRGFTARFDNTRAKEAGGLWPDQRPLFLLLYLGLVGVSACALKLFQFTAQDFARGNLGDSIDKLDDVDLFIASQFAI